MSSLPTSTPAVTRRRPLLRLWALLSALAVAGCGPGGLPSPSVTGGAAVSPVMTGSSPVVTAPTPQPTDPAGPPAVTLVVGGGVPVRGELGSYVWDGAGSDAPWLVPPPDEAVRARGPYAVTVVPPLVVARWEAAWARVDGGTAGEPEGNASGEGGPVAVPGPELTGTWSLMVDVRFSDGNHGAWYWRLEIGP